MGDDKTEKQLINKRVESRQQGAKWLRKGRRRLEAVLDSIQTGVVVIDAETHVIVDVNPAVIEMFGAPKEQIVGRVCHKFICPTEVGKCPITDLGQTVDKLEHVFINAEGENIPILKTVTSIILHGRKYLVGSFLDITERKQAEEELSRLYNAVNMSTDSIVIADMEGKIIYVNEATLKIYGIDDRRGLIGKNSFDLIAQEDRERAIARMEETLEKVYIKSEDYRIITRDGGKIPVEMSISLIKDADGKPMGFASVSRDITERKRAEDLIRAQRDLGLSLSVATGLDEGIRLCVETAIKVSEMDCGGFYLVDETSGDLNMIFHRGLPPDFVKSAAHYDADSDSTRLVMAGKPLYAQHHKLDVPLDEVRSHERLRAIAIVPVRHEDRVIGCLNIASHTLDEVPPFARDALEITANQIGSAIVGLATRESLRESEERMRYVIQNMPVMIDALDSDRNIIAWNRECEKVTGYSADEIIGNPRSLKMLYKDEEYLEQLINKWAARGNYFRDWEVEIIAKDSSIKYVLWSNISDQFPVPGWASWAVGVDITDRKKMEQELLKVDKLESVGVLAGGIAHDFNNILTGILGNISLARMYEEPGKISERLAEAEKASFRARDLTQQLLTFSRGGVPIKKISSIATVLRNSTAFALSGSNVRCQFSLPDDLWSVEIDEGQINQVINNLIINADQALPEGGKIEVLAENVTVGAQDAFPLEDGEYVKLSIRDQGIGIPKEYLQKIFDPYFTTKQKGSGLGLATSYSIISNHGGYIMAESQVGIGTTFYIYLPAFSEKILIEKKKGDGKPVTGEGRILVVDDEELVRQFLHDMLTNIGYEIIAVADGVEAVNLYKEARESDYPFDAVIMDLTIPGGMGGKETIREFMKIDPGVRAIVSSGYSNDPIMANFKKYGFKGVIAKPYKIRELSEVLNTVISDQ